MKVVGLITEYNPFHNGHLYHLNKSKEITGSDFCIALMSGSFVQRGAPAIYDKYVRASMALEAGADLVLEMPVAFSTASAKEFAAYGVALFSALQAVDTVVFGSECGNLEQLDTLASFLVEETTAYSAALKEYVKSGMTFPEARQHTLSSLLPPEISSLLDTPNNILGVEYLKAAKTLHSSMEFQTIMREGNSYHDNSLGETFVSASAIREALQAGTSIEGLRPFLPPFVPNLMAKEIPVFLNDFSSALNYRIWESGDSSKATIADMTPELAARIQKNTMEFDTFENRIKTLKSRQFTYTRVSRALLHLLLNMEEREIQSFKDAGYAPYARVLGFRKSAGPLLSYLKDKSTIPIVTKIADAKGYLSPIAFELLQQEIRAAHLYQSIKKEKGGVFKHEYTQPIILLP